MKKTYTKFLIIVNILFVFSFFPLAVFAQITSPFDLVNLKLFASGDIAAYEKIKIVEAWDKINQEKALNPAFFLSRVFIGIFDTGIDIAHPEFIGVSIDSALPQDLFDGGHGTQVVGIIGANNLSSGGQYISPQMNGILSGVRNLPLPHVLRIRASGDLTNFTLKDSFRHFVELDRLARSFGGMQIINGSFGVPLCSKLTIAQRALYSIKGFSCYEQEEFFVAKDIYSDLINQYPNILFVFGAGNDGIDAQFNLPGGIVSPNTITVGATNLTDGRSIFSTLTESNFGSSVSVAAPGEKIYAPAPLGKGNFPSDGGDYQKGFSGTSASAPMVTGVAGLLKAIKPNLTPSQIKQILISTADDPIITDKPIGPRLNALNAVCHQLALNCTPPAVTGIIRGTVRLLENGGPINFPVDGAIVTLRKANTFEFVDLTTSDENGLYQFSSVVAGDYVMRAEKDFQGPDIFGFALGEASINIVAGQTISQDIMIFLIAPL